MRKLLLIIVFMLPGMLTAEINWSEYYEKKSQLRIDKEYVGPVYSLEKDLSIVMELAEMLDTGTYEAEIMEERAFIERALKALLVRGKYTIDYQLTACRYSSLPPETRSYFDIIIKWHMGRTKHGWMNMGNINEELANEITETIWMMHCEETTEEGTARVKDLFDRGIYDVSLIYSFIKSRRNKENGRMEIRWFFKEHFDKMSVSDLVHKYTSNIITAFILAYPEDGGLNVINRFLDKIEKDNKSFEGFKEMKKISKHFFLKRLLNEKTISNPELIKKIISFLKQNRHFLEYMEEYEGSNEIIDDEEKNFFLENSKKLSLDREIVERIKNMGNKNQ